MTRRLPYPPAPAPLEDYAAQFDALFAQLAQRRGLRAYLQGCCCLWGAETRIRVVTNVLHRLLIRMNTRETVRGHGTMAAAIPDLSYSIYFCVRQDFEPAHL